MRPVTTVLILGGYGAVGREAATGVARLIPDASVVVGGRNPSRAAPVPGVVARRVDAGDAAELAAALGGVDVVVMCADLDNAAIARACLERGIDYVDVSASPEILAGIELLDDVARRAGATAVLSVGLVPGVSNLLARHCAERSTSRQARIGVLIGSGEHHGPAALEWTVDGLGRLRGTWEMRFPEPHGRRKVHRFPFSDQYTLPRTLGLDTARTGLCLDSRAVTAVLAGAGHPAAVRVLRQPRVRRTVLRILGRVHVGSDEFAVTVACGDVRAGFSGRGQSRATGLAAAHLLRRLPGLPPGVAHIEQRVDPGGFLTDLAADGFTYSPPGTL